MMSDPAKLSSKDLRNIDRDGGPREAAHYIAGAIAELASMARVHGQGMLGYLLDMAHLEAEETVRRLGRKRAGR